VVEPLRGDPRAMTRSMFRTARSPALIVLAVAVFLVVSGSYARAQLSSAAGGTYYVSPDGSDTATGTEGAPFRTIQKAADGINL
jgi:hypothetical protein